MVLTQNVQPVFEYETTHPRASALCGFIQSLAKEQPRWRVKHIDLSRQDLENRNNHPVLLDRILREPANPEGHPAAYRQQYRYVQRINPLSIPEKTNPRIRRQGVFVILGGAGGLGVAFSEYLIKTHDARMVWLGRRALDETIHSHMDRLGRYGTRPVYIRADATNPESLKRAAMEIKQGVSPNQRRDSLSACAERQDDRPDGGKRTVNRPGPQDRRQYPPDRGLQRRAP